MTILETNLERILADNLWKEVDLIDAEVKKQQSYITDLETRRQKLIKIADAAELPREGV